MTLSKSYNYVSPECYLEGEKVSPIKHEYRQGEIYAMAGASDAHETICINLVNLLTSHVRGRGCRIYAGNMKARIEEADVFYYPDIMVTCDERDRSLQYFKRYPRLIVEVLSPTTAAFDRGNKFADYRTIETLQEYVVINQESIGVECYRRNSEGRWELYPYGVGAEVRLDSADFQCPIASIYEDVLEIG
ncbi:MAG: Uma2 family endonuclease [Microcoleus sp. PH2017_25_DOB_D_A]|uniref:Uma2 family endonuclease n=1 Tax=unclassified Microcoleus TaxID=2642155 RepID=UPI001DD309B5|nr:MULTISPECIES: Uma2 family endonuclease [unclassified Microcoleus]TAE45189.1 MAG: Uma2 family endonuclease [Oscillatoriales cyanobacterium]MCC3489056.1 Uma2 family endonuclease [Microcoleus sp. PH2017_16_JOR_D_A]MCC3532741.1 Uma2 family endonuclease [Microcoleus sp. PH2017_25_DOB_D_A]MCC3545141.1 Uma2 family endonuclease [Microcoleus sp. PH2017_24_DOB_U_A]MCC3563906.1 Uma2 family endonuclease [Microcoleus sp. PH2017_31_RDM_U_A]